MRIKEKRGEGGLRKKGILLCFMSFLLLVGCEKKENTPNPQEALQQEAACGAVQMGRKGMEY